MQVKDTQDTKHQQKHWWYDPSDKEKYTLLPVLLKVYKESVDLWHLVTMAIL